MLIIINNNNNKFVHTCLYWAVAEFNFGQVHYVKIDIIYLYYNEVCLKRER